MQINPDTRLDKLESGDEITFTTETGTLGIPVDVTGRVTDVSTRTGDVLGPFRKTVVRVVSDDSHTYELTRTVSESHTSEIDVSRENPFHPAEQNCGTVTEVNV